MCFEGDLTMGELFVITCRNKECKYSVRVLEGPGMILFSEIKTLEQDILSGKEEASEEILNLLRDGNELECVSTYLCPKCHEWQGGRFPYVLEKKSVSPNGTILEYKIHYLNGTPKCKKCNTELEFVLNPKSGKNKCPKCGADNMQVDQLGYYD